MLFGKFDKKDKILGINRKCFVICVFFGILTIWFKNKTKYNYFMHFILNEFLYKFLKAF